jgi:hypothetical protein
VSLEERRKWERQRWRSAWIGLYWKENDGEAATAPHSDMTPERHGSSGKGHGTVPVAFQKWFQSFQMVLNILQTHSNLIRSKRYLLEFEEFEITYGYEGFDERNNFSYRNFSRFERKFELKLRFLSKFESKEAGHLGSLCALV